jgi:hypothetical protein
MEASSRGLTALSIALSCLARCGVYVANARVAGSRSANMRPSASCLVGAVVKPVTSLALGRFTNNPGQPRAPWATLFSESQNAIVAVSHWSMKQEQP